MNRFVLLLTLTLLVCLTVDAGAKEMSVQVQESHLRSTPSYFGAVVMPVKYADRLVIEETKKGWSKVSFGNKSGWIHESALTKKKLVLASGKQVSSSVSSDELSAAEKGFTKQIENDYKKRNKDVDFAWIDKMEKIKVSPKETKAFLAKGKVVPADGGVK